MKDTMQEPKAEYITCRECGKKEKLSWVTEMNARLKSRSLCFTCDYWLGFVWRKEKDSMVRVKNDDEIMHYVIASDRDGGMRGFGGARFKIKFHDGRIVKTRNLWCQGEVPERFRDRLPVNAEFVYDT